MVAKSEMLLNQVPIRQLSTVLGVTSLRFNNCLHSPWHALQRNFRQNGTIFLHTFSVNIFSSASVVTPSLICRTSKSHNCSLINKRNLTSTTYAINNEKNSGIILMLIEKLYVILPVWQRKQLKTLCVFFSAFFNQRSNLVERVNYKRLKIIECGLRHSIGNLLQFLNLTDLL